jgi:uncharacterized protein YndB with AHSA1/START domain
MAQRILSFLARFSVPPERLFEVLADHEGMRSWTGADVTVIAGPGDGGLGTMRRVKIGPLTIDEEVVFFDPPHRFIYRIVRGLPVKYHQGEVRVSPWGDGGSELHWDITLVSSIPGVVPAIAATLGPGLNRALRKLATELE